MNIGRVNHSNPLSMVSTFWKPSPHLLALMTRFHSRHYRRDMLEDCTSTLLQCRTKPSSILRRRLDDCGVWCSCREGLTKRSRRKRTRPLRNGELWCMVTDSFRTACFAKLERHLIWLQVTLSKMK